MPRKIINIGSLTAEQQAAIQSQIKEAKNADKTKDADVAKESVDFYYKVKTELEDILFEKLKLGSPELVKKIQLKSQGKPGGWSKSKVLKQIADMPAKKPIKNAGYITAARNIEHGKPKRLTKEEREERKLEAANKKKKATQIKAASTLFKKAQSDRNKNARESTKKTDKPKSAGAMATTTKEQRYESKRKTNQALKDRKNAARRLRRENGKKN